MSSRAPLIVIGMHRSGTAMITRVLERLGVFMGERLSHNAESQLFVDLNDWLMRQGGGAWDHPQPTELLLQNPEVRALALDYLRSMLGSPRAASFVGWSRYLRGRTPLRLETPWGWKDPRTTYTLPLWLDLFPDARVLNVSRHGVDVASSLKTRYERGLPQAQSRYRRRRRLYLLRPKHTGLKSFLPTLRCATLEGGFGLWELYVDEALRHVDSLGPRALDISFEEFLEDPENGVASLAEFCGLTATADTVGQIARGVESGRAYAYRKSPELVAFATRVGDRLRRHGYEPGEPATGGHPRPLRLT